MMDKYLFSEDTKGITFQEEASFIKAACSDPTIFRKLYLDHVRPIYQYIFSKVGEVRQTEDLTAQVFLEALENLSHYRYDGHFVAWLFGIARHKIADHFRSQHLEVRINVITRDYVNKDDPLATLIQAEDVERTSIFIHQLDEYDQELLRLRFVAELSYAEIARLMHSNMEATKKRCYRLLTYLRHQLEPDHD
jgi:RNA polymerase sigma-70 factor (ECF subfamily)